ncbi:integrase core domain-containing protein [Nitrosospira briensis]|uniref:integrase core domain-containing protein n=1 Tax=Nitrosospira briensis TaxID=35799 RepID=UPI000B06839E|nr:integrase core domain-containing protein [Nitrosospira briensis]
MTRHWPNWRSGFAEARVSIMQYMDWYNRSGPHASLGKKTPDEAYAVMLPTIELAA